MRAKVVFDVDGTTTRIFEGHHISTQIFPGGGLLLKVTNKKGKVTYTFQAGKIYFVEKWK